MSILLLIMYLSYSLTFVVSKQNLLYAQPFFLTASRMVVAGLLLLLVVALKNRSQLVIPKSFFKQIGLISFFGIFVTNALEFWGLSFITPTRACFLFCLTPFATCLLSFLILNEKISRNKWIGLLTGFLGAAFVIRFDAPNQSGMSFSWAEWAVVGASFATALSWIMVREFLNSSKGSLLPLNAYSMLFGGILLGILSWVCEDWRPVPVFETYPFLGWLSLTIVISNCIGYNLYAFLLRVFSASFITLIGFLTPFMTAGYQWLFFGKPLSLDFVIGASITFLGLLLFYREEMRLGYSLKRSQ